MVIQNGYYPLGEITYKESLTNFAFLPTDKIIEENGVDKVLEAYTLVQPADILVSTPDNHGMMAIERANVVKNEDGSIDLAKSFIMIQDQRGGQGQGFYEQQIDGELIQFSGRTSFKFTFEKLLEKGYIPVVSTIGCDETGHVYNINADTAASEIAKALRARKLVFVSDVPGVLADRNDESSVIPTICTTDIPKLSADGVLSGGMLPKVQSCAEALNHGINKVHLIDGRLHHSLLLEIFTTSGVGTQIIRPDSIQ